MFEVFGKPNCKYCTKAKDLLDELGVDYRYTDLTQDDAAMKMIKAEGHTTVPVISLNGGLIGGFTELEEFVKDFPKNP
jgi:glutaredoxin